MIPASALDGHALSTLRTVAIVLDAVPDWSVLRSRYPADHPVTVVGGASERSCTLADAERESAGASFVVVAPLDPFADLASLETVARIAERLRAPNGCPWDREQTHASLRPHLLEEAYEALAALDSGDPARLRDELGDLLLQIVLHGEIAREEGTFDAREVARRLNEKLIRRHPHVFAGRAIAGGDLLARWEAIKREEKGVSGGHYLASLPAALPALMRAQKAQKKAARVNFDWAEISDVVAKVDEELAETKEAIASRDPEAISDEIGDLLFAVVNLARKSHLDAETTLQAATDKFVARFNKVEDELHTRGKKLGDVGLEELDQIWNAVKADV